jgi:methylase of polypeptide subunit release factors
MNLYMAAKKQFMRYWYWHVGTLNRLMPTIDVSGKTLVIEPGVYKPLENESACAEYCHPGDRVLDLGCGSGVNTVFCAPIAREVMAVDISAAAVRNTGENCRRHGITNIVLRQSDMFSQVDGKFDLILANPPYIAADFDDEEKQFATSTRYLPTLLARAGNHLEDGGRLLIQFPMWFKPKVVRLAAKHGWTVKEVRRMPPKSLGLFLLSLAYMQVGFRSAFYLLEPVRAAATAPQPQATQRTAA